MNEPMTRVLLYGSAALVLAGIGVAWCNTDREAGVLTLLSSASSQLQMAYAIPPVDKQGRRLDKRDLMIDDAIVSLEKVERAEPGMACTAEFRGFAHMLQEQYVEAAACYRAAKSCEDCGDEQRDILTFNQARMLAKAGKDEQALEVFASHGDGLDQRFGHQRRIEEAQILSKLGRDADARTRLDVVMSDSDAAPMARLQAGKQYLELGVLEAAEVALSMAQTEIPIADYYLAQLKLRQGEVDISIELLERARKARPAEVRQLLLDEANAWSAVAQSARFQELTKPLPASPGR